MFKGVGFRVWGILIRPYTEAREPVSQSIGFVF